MGQFKPMVKMMTTEPTVELKLKKGGKVEKKMQMGGALAPSATPTPPGMPATGGMPGGQAPMRPSLAARRRMMRNRPSGAAPAGPVGDAAMMQGEGQGQITDYERAQMQQAMRPAMKKGGDVAKELKKHKDMPASKAHKGLKTGGVVKGQGGYKTGGVVNGQGGYKTGGVVDGQGGYKKGGKVDCYAEGGVIGVAASEKGAKEYKNTKMVTTKPDHSPAKTGGVKLGNGGGYKKGGAAKKYAEGGAVNDAGKAEKMPQGRKKPSAPVSITELSGTFKKGGQVKSMTPAEKRLTKMFDKENAPAMKAAKSKDVEIYSKYGKAMKSGGKC
jgi:hypothetical protein